MAAAPQGGLIRMIVILIVSRVKLVNLPLRITYTGLITLTKNLPNGRGLNLL